ncbi:MAG: PDZ domain-containing protein [Candidatus Eisenbacteria bacterium]
MRISPTMLGSVAAARPARSSWLVVAGMLLAGAAAIAVALALTAGLARAGSTPCPEGQPVIGDVGIIELSGLARFSASGDEESGYRRQAMFRTEPRLVRIAEAPTGGLLREGDAIVAIDGALITTREGGRRLANLTAGQAVTFSVRRDGRRFEIRVVPVAQCGPFPAWVQSPEQPEPPEAPEPPEPAETPRAPQTPPTPGAVWVVPRVIETPRTGETTPAPLVVQLNAVTKDAERAGEAARVTAMLSNRGWFGLGIDCEDCRWQSLPGDSGVMWVSREYPTIYRVDPGSPAERAGLQRGDVLTQLDGMSLLTPEGGRRFGAVKPGQRVRWTYRRDGRPATAVAVAEARPGALGMYAQSMADMREQLKRMSKVDSHDEAVQRQVAQMESSMRQREAELALQRAQLAGLQRLRWTGSVGDADVEVKGLGNVTVTTDDATGEIVVVTSDATIHIRPSAATPPSPPKPSHTPKSPKAPKPPKE